MKSKSLIKKVMFLCTGNHYRSRIAEEIFNNLAKRNQLKWKAHSSGLISNAATIGNIGPMSAEAITMLKSNGYEVFGKKREPTSLQMDNIEDYELIICLDEEEHMPMVQDLGIELNVSYWNVKDREKMSFQDAFDRINQQVNGLISELLREN